MRRKTKIIFSFIFLAMFVLGILYPFISDNKPIREAKAYIWFKDAATNATLAGVFVRVRQFYPPYNETKSHLTSSQGVIFIVDTLEREYAILATLNGYEKFEMKIKTSYKIKDYFVYMKAEPKGANP